MSILSDAARYWSDDNKAFEAKKPGYWSRVGRAVDPRTALGSAMGAMHDRAGAGDVTGMGLAAAQGVPGVGLAGALAKPFVTAAAGALKDVQNPFTGGGGVDYQGVANRVLGRKREQVAGIGTTGVRG